MPSSMLFVSSMIATIATLAHMIWPWAVIRNSGLKKKRRKKLQSFNQKVYGKVILITFVVGLSGQVIMNDGEISDLSRAFYHLAVAAVHLWAASLTVNFVKQETNPVAEIVANK